MLDKLACILSRFGINVNINDLIAKLIRLKFKQISLETFNTVIQLIDCFKPILSY